MRRPSGPCWYLVVPLACLLAGARAAGEERPVTGTAVPAFRPVDDAVGQFMDTIGCQAATVAISRDGKLLYSRGYGWAEADRQRPTPPDALLRIASVSKPITAAEVKKLIRDGKLSLQTRAFPLLALRSYNGKGGDPRLADITVGQLLEHEGGWDAQKSFDPMFMTRDIEKALHLKTPATPVNVIEYMLARPLQFAPGERSAYSNFGYCVLGRVIEQVTGRPYGDAVRHDLFRPLGIEDIRLGHSAARDRDPREVWYPVADDAFPIEVLDAHGGWVASAPALCRFLDAYWLDGEPRGPGDGGSWTFFGSLPGTTAMARQRPDGINIAVLVNGRRDDSVDSDCKLLLRLVDRAVDRAAPGAPERGGEP
jgi:N-acyl-D-amino-acid deacylase